MTNTADKYLWIPVSELSARDARAWPDGKRVKNPNYVEPTEEQEAREYRNKLLAIPGSKLWESGDKKRVYFNLTEIGGKHSFFDGFYDLVSREFSSNTANKEAGAEMIEAFRDKYGV